MKKHRTSRILSMILALCMVLSIAPLTVSAEQIFSDVAEEVWYSDAVGYMYYWGLMNGMGDDQFAPGETLNRAMIVTILYRWEGEPDVSGLGNPFSDVPAGTWYTDAVKWASANDIVSGYGGGLFGPNDPVTKEQLAAIVYRVGEATGLLPPAIGAGVAFTDISDVSDWAYDAVSALNKLGVFFDIPSVRFGPQVPATRAEVACIVYRYIVITVAANDGWDGDDDYYYDDDGYYEGELLGEIAYIVENDCMDTWEYIENGLIPWYTYDTVEIDGDIYYLVYFYMMTEDGEYFETDIVCAVSVYPAGVFQYDNESDEWIPFGLC